MATVDPASVPLPNGDTPKPQSQSLVRLTNLPSIKNAPFPAEGNGSFSNAALAGLVLGVPYVVKRILPLVNRGGSGTYWFLVIVLGLPVTVAYWTAMSMYGARKNDKLAFPNRPQSEYFEFKDQAFQAEWEGKKIPMQIFHDAYFEGKVDFKGDVLDTMEWRHDWAEFKMTPELFKYVFTVLIPDVVVHSHSQDEEQVRDHYDRGDDFYGWFLGPRMIYTSGVVMDNTREETLEELQDNKLALVCEKLDLKPTDKLLDIGCGWGTLAAYAAKNYSCDVTGVTLAKKQAAFGNQRIKDNGCDTERARILCMDFRDVPAVKGQYTKIVSLEMAEHVGIRRYNAFLRQVYDLLDDDGIFVFQVAGIRQCWQYEDLIWGLFMNKYVFPGADASCALNWVIGRLEGVGFEIKAVDVLGVHYSATIWRWYKNWISNKDKVIAAYGERWFRVWSFFLAYSTIISRQGSASVFQITAHKNLNAFHRMEGLESHTSLRISDRAKNNASIQ
ncbi:putative fatty acid methyltransferase [Rhizoctonia solani AG-1 IB]|uniref:sphingolipid C(9)-methyltransferase n=1 Tax=Thanatephorus cucumeris (strain AG1-IB / isolate 7/3/14) TaxID=1108050 RepID=M5CAG9_THACB|nr:putative fatty acid methyltransferase [Rhizoctonia solani AG-1 IB]